MFYGLIQEEKTVRVSADSSNEEKYTLTVSGDAQDPTDGPAPQEYRKNGGTTRVIGWTNTTNAGYDLVRISGEITDIEGNVSVSTEKNHGADYSRLIGAGVVVLLLAFAGSFYN